MSCEECAQLFKQGFKKDFPCGDCPQQAPLSSEALHAWEIFKRSASRSTIKKDGVEKTFFEVDWNLAAWLMQARDENDPYQTTETILSLLNGLNG